MGQLRTYNASEVSVVFGARALSGLADGTFVVCERDEQSFTKQVGSTGEVTRSKTSNKAGKVTVTLQQSSADNEYLTALLVTDELTSEGSFPIIVRDASGSTLIAVESAWIQKAPNVEFGRDAGTREWVADCANMEVFIGKN